MIALHIISPFQWNKGVCMSKRFLIFFLLLTSLVACQNTSFPDVKWKYIDSSDQTTEPSFKNDKEKIKWYTKNGYICIDNVIYGPNTLLYANAERISYYVFGSYGESSNITILDEVNGLPVTYVSSGFQECSHLRTLYIGKNIENISTDALQGCFSLTNIVIDDNNKNLVFSNGLLYTTQQAWCSLIFCSPEVNGTVRLPENTSHVSTMAFSVASEITEIVVGKDLVQFSDYGYLPKLFDIKIAEENNNFTAKEGVIYSKDEKRIEYICPNRFERFEIPESVTTFGCSFNHCTRLKTIVINEQLDAEIKYTYDEPHFYPNMLHCPSLEEIIVNDKNPWLTSYDGCLYRKDLRKLYCVPEGKSEVTLHEKTESICSYAFANFKSNILVIPDKVDTIGFLAFDGSSIDSVVLGSGIAEIDDRAFTRCFSKINDLYYHGTVEQLSKVQIHEHNKYLVLATRYYYSEEKPTERGRYWHYVDGAVTKW